MVQPADREFYAGLPLFEAFEGVADEANYRPLPDGWWLAVADIVNSTGAIAEGRYKSVNMAGASVISALMNGLDERNLAFVFGGDGALAAVPGTLAAKARTCSQRRRHGWRRSWASSFAPRSSRFPTCAPAGSTCVSRASRRARKSLTLCFPAAAPVGRKRK